ncbi:DUF5675 family protein [Flammeovirga agarivorans]|uniref:SH3 domain-containing protein n=1 Tax=Flammeovirga agarivorans TaxID=2726742 RepID=A0A7X8SGZ0_9BACT|nr:DUF5675 family protein [Flammeovirga agarivorans]NLR90075.1 SH3 domain-containing protein [Flammeovirga agarivorans]
MKAILKRTKFLELQTQGKFELYNNDDELVFSCDTLELPWKDNQNRISCIPLGEYKTIPRTHGAYANRAFHVQEKNGGEVKGRSHILIHSGNFFTDTKGCILLGRGFHDIALKTKKREIQKDGVMDLLNSRQTISELLELSDGFELSVQTDEKVIEKKSNSRIKIDFIKEGEIAYVNVKSKLNLRSEPNTESLVIDQLVDDTPLLIKEDLGEWMKVATLGVEGWCFGEYISLIDSNLGVVSVNSGTLNIRSDCHVKASKILEKGLNKEEKVEILEKRGDWYRVKARIEEGFVFNEFLIR